MLWLTGARLFDGTGTPLRENAAILVENGVIRRVAAASEACPDGARQVDVGQRVLMPGLTDAHTHASGEVPRTAKGAEAPLPDVAAHFLQAELRDYLRYGVTTIRVCGSQGDMPQQARQAMRYGAFRGPRLLTCGKIVDPATAQARPEMPPVLAELAERNLREGAASMRAARDAGVKIALGSDMSLATGLEIQRMVQHGLTGVQALVAATSTAAQALTSPPP